MKISNGINEKCAVFGIWDGKEAARYAYFGLFALQHRGQEQTGIASTDGKKIFSYKKSGLVSQVYTEKIIKSLEGFAAIGHNRYSTSRGSSTKHAQPIVHNDKFAFAHNGNLPNTKALEDFLKNNKIVTKGHSDSELMAKAIGFYMDKGMSLSKAVEKAYPLFTGAFSCVALSTKELVAFRDPRGIRPLVVGTNGEETVFASETCGLRTVNAKFLREVLPGELVTVSKSGMKSTILATADPKFDIFEFVYFSRHDCKILGQSVYEVRKNFGKMLFKENPKLKLDLIVPVPETAIPSAIGYSHASGVPFEMALNKNRYIHRTFIEPTQANREQKIKMKLTVLRSLVTGKRVGVIDDSIVRGNTSRDIAKMFFDSGAKEVHFLVASAPVKFPDFYGIDTPRQENLISSQKTIEETRQFIGATSLTFLSIDGMVKATGLPKGRLCLSAFNGEYPLPIYEHEKEIKYDSLRFKN
ncbi:amidophosphoribosyltransferase [Candidatus Nomurabacteria bacterium RIFOXYC2_FULL_36_8]|nr:MAG: Amidophosphoribosyltransferase [Candidatus Nomurabacteria bacterium GW2011_GWE2_36_115]KKP94345.1 MAG: Amidophosphoribosyltransferase [Candidatus Nomurabacteria bacterium GW2011_GWF2_36_126]KKP96829.1 MAG: Amidophosphoribosyltransferase [Candidatus Nomurabacteria bacterium GW2011_GWD2_36_14]KKP99567.1 MAG: Amidophosphoribosyltransferase [Candidatus Nomurabacteria bacterium GW2011_GWF2_36_19]KKQ05563.1 MAG: Amidophosphoribosyltransferase [Candidatus Nomurabacteria bacterium GW2011_GWF1_3